MRAIVLRAVAVAALVFIMATGTVAQTWNCSGPNSTVTATLSDGTLTVSGSGAMREYGDPALDLTWPPWIVNDNYRNSITSVVIENGVSYIGSSAFYFCKNLTSVTIGNSVGTIGESAFGGCTGLTSVTIPNRVAYIENGAFSMCTGLTSITIPKVMTMIGEYAFYGCTGLTSVTLPDSVTRIGHNAFRDCAGLTSVTIPKSGYFGAGVFAGCTGLTSVTIPNSVYRIESSTFSGCISLTSVTIPNGVTSIESSAFENCTGLTSVTIPNSVTRIESLAFENCTGLTSVTIPNSVTRIQTTAFQRCTGLTSVTIGDGLTSITGFEDIINYTNLTNIEVGSGNPMYSSIDGVLFNKAQNILQIYPRGKQGAYSIPNSVTSIRSSLFQGCTGLTSVTIPNSVTSIGSSAFQGCTNLTSVTIGDGVTSIGSSAFQGCTGLTSVTSLRVIPPSATSAFYDVPSSACLYVPYAGINYYRSSWNSFSCIQAFDSPPAYDVTFNSMGGSAVNPQSVLRDEKVAMPAAPTLPSYNFGGWYKDAACTVMWNFSTDVVTSDITLYAKWTSSDPPISAEVPTITVHPQGGTVTVGTTHSLTVSADVSDGGTLSYQWYVGGIAISGAIGTLFDAPIDAVGTSYYYVTITNTIVDNGDGGIKSAMVTSDVVTLTVEQSDAVKSFDRVIPNGGAGGVAVVAPAAVLSGEFAAGPNPVGRSSGGMVFFWNGKALSGGTLTVYDAAGNVVKKIIIKDNAVTGNLSKRAVGSWDLKDGNGHPVSEGTYLVRGQVATFDGKSERAAVVVGVR